MARSRKSIEERAGVSEPTEEDLPINDIVVGGKYSTNYKRRTDDEIVSFSKHLSTIGKLHDPIWVVRDKEGHFHLAAGEKRLLAGKVLQWTTIRAKVFAATSVRARIGQTVAILRALENSRDGASFGDRVRSVRQMVVEKLSTTDIAATWNLNVRYVEQIAKYDGLFPAGWEDRLTKNQADLLAGCENPVDAYELFVEHGTLPERRTEMTRGRGRGAKAESNRGKLVAEFPWAADFPWESTELKLGVSKDEQFCAWKTFFARFAERYNLPRIEPVQAA